MGSQACRYNVKRESLQKDLKTMFTGLLKFSPVSQQEGKIIKGASGMRASLEGRKDGEGRERKAHGKAGESLAGTLGTCWQEARAHISTQWKVACHLQKLLERSTTQYSVFWMLQNGAGVSHVPVKLRPMGEPGSKEGPCPWQS